MFKNIPYLTCIFSQKPIFDSLALAAIYILYCIINFIINFKKLDQLNLRNNKEYQKAPRNNF